MTTVTVGCKLPNGLILEMGKKGDANHKTATLNGANAAAVQVAGGYGLTEVDGAFYEAWAKKHHWLPALKSGAIFVQDNRENATAAAIDTSELRTGLERLDPKAAPKGIVVDADHMAQSRRDVAQAQRA